MKNVGEVVAAFVQELIADGPAVAVDPRLLLKRGYRIHCTRPAPHNARAGNQLRKNTIFGVQPKVLVLPESYACTDVGCLVECDGYGGCCCKHEVDVTECQGDRKKKDDAKISTVLAVVGIGCLGAIARRDWRSFELRRH